MYHNEEKYSWAWGTHLLSSSSARPSQEDCEFKTSLGNLARPGPKTENKKGSGRQLGATAWVRSQCHKSNEPWLYISRSTCTPPTIVRLLLREKKIRKDLTCVSFSYLTRSCTHVYMCVYMYKLCFIQLWNSNSRFKLSIKNSLYFTCVTEKFNQKKVFQPQPFYSFLLFLCGSEKAIMYKVFQNYETFYDCKRHKW